MIRSGQYGNAFILAAILLISSELPEDLAAAEPFLMTALGAALAVLEDV